MAGYTKTGEKTFFCVEEIGQYRRVALKPDPENVIQSLGVGVASADKVGIGSALYEGNHNDGIAVRMTNAQGTQLGVAHGAIAAEAPLYAADNGAVAATGSVALGAVALHATEDEGFVEYLYL